MATQRASQRVHSRVVMRAEDLVQLMVTQREVLMALLKAMRKAGDSAYLMAV